MGVSFFAFASICACLFNYGCLVRSTRLKTLATSPSKTIVRMAADSASLGLERTEAAPLLLRNQR
jgi:hypothetical protein